VADGERRVVIPYTPRRPFLAFHNRQQRWASLVVHRRGGKTVATINDLQKRALQNTRSWPPPRYAYIAPYYNQAKRIAWNYAKHYADPVPGRDFNESDLKLTYPNGAEIRLFGADNPDSLRGDYLDGGVGDEFGDWGPSVFPLVIRPMLADYQGWFTFIGTPKGKNAFYDQHKLAEANPEDWYTLTLRASESGLIAPKELADMRVGMSRNQYEQEMECSFDAAIKGAYFADLLTDAEREGRVGNVSVDPVIRKRAFFDIGRRDATAIWIVQFVDREIRVLDYIEASGQTVGYYCDVLQQRGHGRALLIFPHDGVNTSADNPTHLRYVDHYRAAGFECDEPYRGKGSGRQGADMQRVEAVRRLLPRMWFNKATTESGRNALAAYHEVWDDDRNIGKGPEHDWASHGADAFGLMAVCYEEPRKHAETLVMPQLGIV
jgi:phage terminase large subunit